MNLAESASWFAIFAMLLGLILVLIRAVIGPTLFDRILAVNMAGTKTVVLVALLGFAGKRPEFLDIGLLYALVNFIATVAILKFKERGRLG